MKRASALRVLISSSSSSPLSDVGWTRSQKQLVFATARYYKADYCTVEVSRDHSECGGGRAQRFQVGGDRCETSVAETVGRRRTSRPTSLPFYFRSERFNPARKRGTLALVTRRPLQLLESRVSRLLLVILWIRGLGLSLADDGT